MMYLVVDGMFGGTGVRDSVDGGYVKLDTLGLSSELAQRVQNWLRRYEAAHYDQFKDHVLVDDLDHEGLEICRAFQVELGDVKTQYFSAASMRTIVLPASPGVEGWRSRTELPLEVGPMTKIPEFRLIAEPLSTEAKEAQGFRWATPEIGTRHKIGGKPEFIQDAVTPNCRSCHNDMVFYGQLDSIGDKLALADCGIVYVFVCFDCFEANAFIQSN